LAAALLVARGGRKPGRLLAGGAAGGAAAGLLGLLFAAQGRRGKKDEGPSALSRLVSKIPIRVKLVAAGGAVKSGGKEAAREVKEAVQEKTGAGA
jgi:hypothetical protein